MDNRAQRVRSRFQGFDKVINALIRGKIRMETFGSRLLKRIDGRAIGAVGNDDGLATIKAGSGEGQANSLAGAGYQNRCGHSVLP